MKINGESEKIIVIGYIVIAAFLMLVMRLWQLQILQGGEYRKLSEANRLRIISIPAPRGIIFDRNGVPLVKNAPFFSAAVIPDEFDRSKVDQLSGTLAVPAEEILEKINKRMTLDDFVRSVNFLMDHDIFTRAFILLRPPFLSESDGIFWAERSLDFAFSAGVECCVIIPVRPGNGAIDRLQEKGCFNAPDIRSLEKVLEYGIEQMTGRVFADLWDLKLFSKCDSCLDDRILRLTEMNLSQKFSKRIKCTCDTL